MRVAIYLLAFANLILFALAGGLNGGESRPASQSPLNELSPDRISIVSRGEPPLAKAAASAKPPDAQACLLWPDLSRAQGDRMALAVEGGGVLLTRETTVVETVRWAIRIPPAKGGKAGADKKSAELKKLGVKRFTVEAAEDESTYTISFGRFDSEAEAQKVLEGLRQKTVRSAKLVEEGAGDGRERLLARGPAERVEALRTLIEGANPEVCDATGTPGTQGGANGKQATQADSGTQADGHGGKPATVGVATGGTASGQGPEKSASTKQ
jgi:hypothetical protein